MYRFIQAVLNPFSGRFLNKALDTIKCLSPDMQKHTLSEMSPYLASLGRLEAALKTAIFIILNIDTTICAI